MTVYLGSTEVDIAIGTATRCSVRVPSPPWVGDASGNFVEPFLDLQRVASFSGVSFAVNKPTKDAANPIIAASGVSTETWDYQKAFASVERTGGTWRAWYAARWDSSLKGSPAYMTSADGLSWTKPNLGIVTYNGNTNNNMLITGNKTGFTCCRYFPAIGKYVMLTETDPAGAANACIYTSDYPDHGFVLVNTIDLVPGSDTNQPKELLCLPDGRWLLYLVTGYSTDQRRVFAGVSATTDLASTFTSTGTLIPYESTTRQPYGIRIFQESDCYYGFVLTYNVSAQTMTHDLYWSRDRLRWSLVSTGWIPLGTTGAWDDSLTWNGGEVVEVNDTWYVYYCGSNVLHDATPPKDARIGRVSIPKGRIGEVSGTGSITTVLLTPGPGKRLYVNGNAAGGGKIEIEVLDANGVPVAGYTQALATDVTTDTFGIEPTWTGGLTMPTGSPIQLKFNLTSAKLHKFTIA